MVKHAILLKRVPALKGKYHTLLREEWGDGTVERVVGLLEGELHGSGVHLQFFWERSPAAGRSGRKEFLVAPKVLEEVLRILEAIRLPEWPTLPAVEKLTRNVSDELVERALRSFVYLAFQTIADLRGETGFFRDLQSLLYLNVVEWLLPKLRSARLEELHNAIVNALGCHYTTVWHDDPPHQQYLRSTLARYIGDQVAEDRALFASFRLTEPESHDFVTAAQSYWAFLLENQRYEDAEAFLVGACRAAPVRALDEIQEMMHETVRKRVLVGTK